LVDRRAGECWQPFKAEKWIFGINGMEFCEDVLAGHTEGMDCELVKIQQGVTMEEEEYKVTQPFAATPILARLV